MRHFFGEIFRDDKYTQSNYLKVNVGKTFFRVWALRREENVRKRSKLPIHDRCFHD